MAIDASKAFDKVNRIFLYVILYRKIGHTLTTSTDQILFIVKSIHVCEWHLLINFFHNHRCQAGWSIEPKTICSLH